MHSALSRKLALDNECVALVLQGGGALGAYQAGVFEELTAIEVAPTWVAGVSIGAINAALIAGNAVEHRIDRLRAFWDRVTSGPAWVAPPFDLQRGAFNQWSAWCAATFGVPGFFVPRLPPAALQPDGSDGALGIYDNAALRSTLEELVDFDRINADDAIRLSVGAVDVATGNSMWFDNRHHAIGPAHIMASCALPPAFAPVEIDGASYWDGGIVSNTPLQYVLDTRGDEKLLVVQVDLFPARGPVPTNLAGVLQRQKDILYSSRSRFTTEKIAEMQRLRGAMRRLIRRLPVALRDDPDLLALDATLHTAQVDIVHLIYRQGAFESASKDYEFSRPSMREHWTAGVGDMRRTHLHLDRLEGSAVDRDVTVYDLAQGYDAAPSSRDEPDHEEKVALVRASRTLARSRPDDADATSPDGPIVRGRAGASARSAARRQSASKPAPARRRSAAPGTRR